ncbi:MAG: hypothetical protein IJX20_02465, partial [Alphaproteobacteria bacterium]|nr:hypothetical protein [Alphaproteobacteria bacterium]
GAVNTDLIVTAHTELGLTSSNSAAIYCNEYSTAGTNAGDWYLPAAGEVYDYIYSNYDTLKPMTSFQYYIWSSTEAGKMFARCIDPENGIIDYELFQKSAGLSTICFLNIS